MVTMADTDQQVVLSSPEVARKKDQTDEGQEHLSGTRRKQVEPDAQLPLPDSKRLKLLDDGDVEDEERSSQLPAATGEQQHEYVQTVPVRGNNGEGAAATLPCRTTSGSSKDLSLDEEQIACVGTMQTKQVQLISLAPTRQEVVQMTTRSGSPGLHRKHVINERIPAEVRSSLSADLLTQPHPTSDGPERTFSPVVAQQASRQPSSFFCTSSNSHDRTWNHGRYWKVGLWIMVGSTLLIAIQAFRVRPKTMYSTTHDHIIVRSPLLKHVLDDNVTLREILTDPNGYHLAMAPAFFGFYGYFGALSAWDESIDSHVLQPTRLKSVAGASAGAMAAILLAAGISPRNAADFCSTMTLDKFADFPGVLSFFRGNKFEQIMEDFLHQRANLSSTLQDRGEPPPQTDSRRRKLLMQDATIPVAVSAFDLQTFRGCIIRTGSMARAARASATFPFLFQPVPVSLSHNNRDNQPVNELLCIDGGITDVAGLHGTRELLSSFVVDDASTNNARHRVINLSVGNFWGDTPPGPSELVSTAASPSSSSSDSSSSSAPAPVDVISISLRNLPKCGPWAMSNGPKAVDAARRAMIASLDVPLHPILVADEVRESHHFELHIDTSKFWTTKAAQEGGQEEY